MNALFYNLEPGCYAVLVPNFISDIDNLYMKILEDVEFESGRSSFHSNVLRAHKYNHLPKEFFPWMTGLCEKFHELSKSLINPDEKLAPNSCLINYYRNGEDYLRWCSDTTKPNYIISLGDERVLQFRKKELETGIEIQLTTGSLLIIYGEVMHTTYQYRIPKSKSEKSYINLTFE